MEWFALFSTFLHLVPLKASVKATLALGPHSENAPRFSCPLARLLSLTHFHSSLPVSLLSESPAWLPAHICPCVNPEPHTAFQSLEPSSPL